MKKICLIGAGGQLGTEIQKQAKLLTSLVITPLYSKDLDITDESAVFTYFENNDFDLVFNCAAYTAVDLAEKEVDKNNAINNLAVKTLATVCEKHQMICIHVSTDFVFDGSSALPLTEDATCNPLQQYGKAKLSGEQYLSKGIVLRTSWLYGTTGNNFVKTMMRLGRERDVLNVVANQVGTPTSTHDLASAMLQISREEKLEEKVGVYHYSNEGVASWYDFAQAIMEYAQIDCAVYPIPDSQYPTPAKRPKYSVLDKTKVKETFQLEIPYWRTSVKNCIEKIIENES